MESISNDLNKKFINSQINYSIKSCKNDELSPMNEFKTMGSSYMCHSTKSQYKYPEFARVHKSPDYLSLYDINKSDFSSLHGSIKSDTQKRHSGYFTLTDGTKHLKSLNEDLTLKKYGLKNNEHEKSINETDNLKISNLDLKQSDKADSSVSETSLHETCARKLSFGKSPDQTHVKLSELNVTNTSKISDHSVYSEHEILINNEKLHRLSDQMTDSQLSSVSPKKEDNQQASPLFLKIMSKLSELPDSMLFCTENKQNNESQSTNNSINEQHGSKTSSINNENRNSTDLKTASDMNISSINSDVQYSSSTLPNNLRLNEKILKSLNKRNIVIVRRPTAPAPTPPQLLAKQRIAANKEKPNSFFESSVFPNKPSLNVLQRNGLKSKDERRTKHRSMYVETDLYKKEFTFESDLGTRKAEKYSSNLVDGLNVFASPASYLTKIKEIKLETRLPSQSDENNNAYKDFRKNLLKDLEYEKKRSSVNFSSKRDDNNSNLNQIEESLKCFSYLDNLDDSLSLDDNNNNKKQTHSNTDNKKTYEALDKTKFNRQENKSEQSSSPQSGSKEPTMLTIHTPSSLNYNIRMNNTDKLDEVSTHRTHHSDEPTIKLRAKNNELVASINIMEASLTNSVKSHRRESREPKATSLLVLDEKIEEIEKTANFEMSSNESETENSHDTRKSSNTKKNIIIKKVKTDFSSQKKSEQPRIDSTNTAKITNNYNNNNIVIINSTSSKSPRKTSKIVDIHLIEKPKSSEHEKEKVKVKVPVIHAPASSTSASIRPISIVVDQVESEKLKNRSHKKSSSDKEKEREKEKEKEREKDRDREKTNGEKNKIIIKKSSNSEDSKYHLAELNLKRFNGIVTIDPKSIQQKSTDRTILLTERPKTTVPMDTCVNHALQHPTFLRKISTPPPLPNILDKLDLLSSPKGANQYTNNYENNLDNEIKVINSNPETKNHVSSSLRPVSITSSIRSGKSEKPLRLNHGIPPPPILNLKQESSPSQKHNTTSSQQQNTSSSKKYDSNTRKILPLTSNLITKLKLTEISKKPSSSNHQENDYTKDNKNRHTEQSSEDSKKEKNRIQTTQKPKAEKPANSVNKKVAEEEIKPKTNVKTLVLNGMSTNIPVDENFGGRCTNLPQLGAIDYIYKTSDDRYMTSQSPFNYDKKPKSKESDKQTKQPNTSETPSVSKKSSPTHKQTNNDEMIEKYDSSLPWVSKDIKNGKNFYENYAKENDRRKKEGNGFLMLLPGIAIPIDTDANDSDEDATSDSLD